MTGYGYFVQYNKGINNARLKVTMREVEKLRGYNKLENLEGLRSVHKSLPFLSSTNILHYDIQDLPNPIFAINLSISILVFP